VTRRRAFEPVPVALFVGGLALLWLVPLLWGSTWMIEHGRLTALPVAAATFGGWYAVTTRRGRPR
jgi:hypothetical protein